MERRSQDRVFQDSKNIAPQLQVAELFEGTDTMVVADCFTPERK